MTKTHHAIDYIEWAATDLSPIKDFYAKAFGWSFIDYGPTYAALDGAGLDGGFQAEAPAAPAKPLVILYSENLEQSREDVLAAGGTLTLDIFDFPGGRRFQFTDPSGNELGIWSDK
ncbi:VOC family protein [Asticcacaulis machinosus]|uniref:VOC family protein n=1 Tax=Asticcacaulis machinosus TaxID=2984211 RepID=A0ABT5HNZ8_9CAUL|nr:VOC family protein [Asticcacaulis machinosus]MDC7677753.1 VOC family protein [Asticcacaulis machinosus]